ncbi:hypothetical protein Hypma_001160 [Hypsizygus marmoreus]|uniref:Tyr recombinase domain-containing protein n=1 Tax=Hypsizygus marmoreus TaxID=39966 RepID=A0A369J8N2_HYPMA|nr:hypothetical protein Hypma_001160 [Hypsizygus marmoreus]
MANTTSAPHAQTNNAEDTTTDSVAAQPTLQALNAAQAAACEEFGRPPTTRKSYNGYLARGFKFLQNLVDARREAGNGEIGDDGVDTDLLEKAFGNPPNKYSLMALEAFMTQKCFHEGKGEATANGIQSAFADYWDHMGGRGVYATEYFYNEADDTFRGSPARAPSIRDMIKAVKARAKVKGADRVHAEAMRRPELKKAMNCSEDVFPSEAARRRAKDMEELLVALKELEMRAMFTSGFKLWTRNFELNGLRARHITRDCIGPGPHYYPHIKVLVENRKGYQGRTGNDGPLETKQYNIYPDPNAPEMDMYSHLLRWLDYLERHIGRPLKPDEFIFPYISSNGTIELNRAYKHSKIQKLINKFTLRAGLTKYYTTHCFRRGGAQYRFMDAPMEERWSLRAVRWWGAWADNESVETLMKYLFDTLQNWETSYGDQLCPSGPRESFMDNHRHERPATAKEFKDFSSSLLAAVQAAIHPQHDGSAGAPPAVANPSALRASSVSPSIENAPPPLTSVSHRPSTLSMLGAFPVNMNVTHLPSPPPTTTAGPSTSNTGPSTSNAEPSASSAGWMSSSDASLFSPIVRNPTADPALINSFISPPIGLPMGYSPYTAVLPHFNPLTTHHPWAFPSASSPVLDPFFDGVSHHGGGASRMRHTHPIRNDHEHDTFKRSATHSREARHCVALLLFHVSHML